MDEAAVKLQSPRSQLGEGFTRKRLGGIGPSDCRSSGVHTRTIDGGTDCGVYSVYWYCAVQYTVTVVHVGDDLDSIDALDHLHNYICTVVHVCTTCFVIGSTNHELRRKSNCRLEITVHKLNFYIYSGLYDSISRESQRFSTSESDTDSTVEKWTIAVSIVFVSDHRSSLIVSDCFSDSL